jgi:hypothetical protein
LYTDKKKALRCYVSFFGGNKMSAKLKRSHNRASVLVFFSILTIFAFVPVSARPNLALYRPVVASSIGEDNPPGKAVNGVANDRWESQTTDTEWMYIDLGIVYSVDSVFVSWETAAGLDYAIEVANTPSKSETGWTTVAHVANGAQGEKRSMTFTPVQARYVRLQGYKRASIFGYSIWEFEVYGNAAACVPPVVATDPADRTYTLGLNTSFNVYANGTDMSYQGQRIRLLDATWFNIPLAANAYYALKPVFTDSAALFRCIVSSSCGADTSAAASLSFSKKAKINLACKKPAKCTSFEGTDMTAASAVDDDSSTRWGGNYKTDPNKDSAWMYVDLGAVVTIDSVFIDWEHSGAKEYYVQTAAVASDNDQGWTNAAHITDGNAWEKRPIKIAQTQARFVRVRCLKRISDFSYSIFELEVYGPSSTPVLQGQNTREIHDVPFLTVAPGRNSCTITINGSRPAHHAASVFSMQGQLIRTIPGSSGNFMWDYSGQNGSMVTSGVYLIKVSSPAKTACAVIDVCN